MMNIHRIFLASLLLINCAIGSEPEYSSLQTASVPIKGIVLVNSHREVCDVEEWEPGVQCRNLILPGYSYSLIHCLERNYLGMELNHDILLEIKETILNYYRSCHHPFVIVEIPCQNITQGIIQFVVIETRVSDINACGCNWFSNDYIASRLRIVPGQSIAANALLTEVAWMNQNPFHRTNLTFKPGTEPGTTSVELATQDRFPFRPYIGVDNTGNRATGYSRYFTGVTWGDVFGLDHLLTYQLTFDGRFSRFIGHTINYTAPLSWKNTLYLFGGYATVRPDIEDFIRCKGHSGQASIRYEIPIGTIYEDTYQDIRFGFDYKNTNNNLVFLSENEIPLIVHDINLSQFMVAYDAGFFLWGNLLEADFELFCSPGQLLPDETDRDYAMLHPGATAKYLYGRATLGYVYGFCEGMTLGFVARGQYSNRNLLPSEQFGLGGYDTVRGYNEREVNVDNAACFNLELRTRPFSLLNRTICGEPVCDQWIGLLFMDFGVGYNHCKNCEEHDHFTLWSIGPGLRYNLSNYVAARLDIGFKLHRTPFNSDNGMHIHFGVIASY